MKFPFHTSFLQFSGINLSSLEQYAARPNRHVIQPPQQAPAPRTPAMLSAGSKAKPAPHIPFHLPPLPDPHAYIRTPVSFINFYVELLESRYFKLKHTTIIYIRVIQTLL